MTIVPNTSLVVISIDEWSMLKSCPESDKVTIGEKDYQLPCQCSCTDCQLHRRRPSNSCPDTYNVSVSFHLYVPFLPTMLYIHIVCI